MPNENGTVNQRGTRAEPALIDGDTGRVVLPERPRQRTPLKTLDNVKRELGRLYRSVKAGEIESEEGSRRAYILNTLGKIIEAADLERRLDAIEKQQARLALSSNAPRAIGPVGD